jgi:hypothetical protein
MNIRRTLTWVAVAALGVGLTTAMTITTTLLSQQPIALASEPLSAGNTLVPQTPAAATSRTAVHHRAAKVHRRVTARRKPAPAKATPQVVQAPAVTSARGPAVTSAATVPTTPLVRTTGAPAPKHVVSTDNSGDQGGKDGAQRENDVQADQPVADD